MTNENHTGDPLEVALTAVKQAVPEPTHEITQKRAFLAAAQRSANTTNSDVTPVLAQHRGRFAHRPSRQAQYTSRLLWACAIFAVTGIGFFAFLSSINQYMTLTLIEVTPTNPMSSLNQLQPITVFNAAQLQRLMILGRGAINTMEYAPDGETLAVATTTGVYLHDTANWEREPLLLGNQGGNVSALAYSDDGARLAAAYTDGVQLWDTANNQAQLHIPTAESGTSSITANITLLDFTADGETLRAFTCPEPINRSTCDRYHVYVWDAATGAVQVDFAMSERVIFGAPAPVFSPNDRWLAVANYTGGVVFYDLATGEQAAQVDVSGQQIVRSMSFTPDSQQFVLMGEGMMSQEKVTYWRVEDLLEAGGSRLAHLTPVRTLRLDRSDFYQAVWADGREWIFSSQANRMTLWNTTMDMPEQTFTASLSAFTDHVKLSPNADVVVMHGRGGILQVWDVASEALTAEITTYGTRGRTAQFDTSRSVVLNVPDGNVGALLLWSLDDAQPTVITLEDGAAAVPVMDAVLYEDGEGQRVIVYTGGIDTSSVAEPVAARMQGIWRYDLDTLSTAFWMNSDHSTRGRPSFRADGTMQRLRAVGNSQSWLVINTPDGQEYTQSLELSPDDILGSSAAFSPDGRLLAATVCQNMSRCNADEIRFWDTLTGRFLARLDLKIIGLAVRSNDALYFSPDGRYLAAHTCYEPALGTLSDQRVCYNGKVRLWDTALVYERLAQLPPPEVTPEPGSQALNAETDFPPLPIDLNLENYPYGLSAGVFSPMNANGDYVLAVSDDQYTTLYLVNPETLVTRRLGAITHSDPPPSFDLSRLGGGVTTATFSPDGTLLAISGDGTIQLWGVSE